LCRARFHSISLWIFTRVCFVLSSAHFCSSKWMNKCGRAALCWYARALTPRGSPQQKQQPRDRECGQTLIKMCAIFLSKAALKRRVHSSEFCCSTFFLICKNLQIKCYLQECVCKFDHMLKNCICKTNSFPKKYNLNNSNFYSSLLKTAEFAVAIAGCLWKQRGFLPVNFSMNTKRNM